MFGLQLRFVSAEHQTLWEDAFSSFFPFADVEERLAEGLAPLEEVRQSKG